jgi:hypothetical protein
MVRSILLSFLKPLLTISYRSPYRGMPIGAIYDMWNVRSRDFPYSKEGAPLQMMKLFLRCSPSPTLAPHLEPLPEEHSPKCKEYHTRRLRDSIAARHSEPPSTPTSDSSSRTRDSILNDRDADTLWESIVQRKEHFFHTCKVIFSGSNNSHLQTNPTISGGRSNRSSGPSRRKIL